MKTRYILRKQLATLPCRFILGCIGHKQELSPEINNDLIQDIERRFGPVKEILDIRDFPNAPLNYIKEMKTLDLATTMIILEQGGAYTDLHHMKKKTVKLEKQHLTQDTGRVFNINPGAVGTYGLVLSSHKPTGGRPDISTYAFGFHPHTLGQDSYYERVARWTGNNLELIPYIKQENKFSEYYEADRMKRFEELIRTLKKSDVSIELMPKPKEAKTE